MKLRLLDSSLRLRLTRSEVSTIGDGGMVEGHSRFPDGSEFRYSLGVDDTPGIRARALAGGLEVLMSRTLATPWATGEAVSLSAEWPLPDGSCRILIEKDFDCLHPRVEDEGADTFPNPTAQRDRS
jgi:hypothetical protein